jgi:NAD-dependent deacetylase
MKDRDARIQRVANLLAESRTAVAFTGTGISTPSGIPDFRSPETGVWARLEAAGADETQSSTIQAFGRDPQTFYQRMKPLFQVIVAAEPNIAHYALAELEAIGIIHAVITQNADMLHQRSGSRNVIEVHGTLSEATCISCYIVAPFGPMLEKFLEDGRTPYCQHCGGVMKPNVILTGEQLPVQAVLAAKQAMRSADVVLVTGTSLAGGTATALMDAVYLHGSKLIIVNQSPTIMDAYAEEVIHMDVVMALPAIVAILREVHKY